MWCYRRVLKTPWTGRVTNEEMLIRLEKRELLKIIKTKNTMHFGHIILGPKYELLQLIVQAEFKEEEVWE